MKLTNIKLGTYFNAGIGISFLVAALVLIIVINHQQRKQALADAEEKALIILNRNLATHKYFNDNLKPKLLALSGQCRSDSYFDPAWMSSSYAIRQIDNYFKSFDDESDYYYKECAVNARRPQNEADEYEKSFIRELNRDKGITSRSSVRLIDGAPYFVMLRRGEVVEKKCLLCHGNPEKAPSGLISMYGSKRGFHRRVGEVASAISLSIPLAAAYAEANRFSWGLSALLIFMFTILFGLQLWINQRFLLQQICAFRDKALQIATDENKLGEQISVAFGREFQEMADAFNVMSATLRKDREHLEELVRERTAELSGANRRLHEEIGERKRIADALHESERRQRTLIANLPGIVYRCRNDRELTMEFISDGCKNLTGYLPQDLVDSVRLSYADLIVPEDRDYVRGTIQAALDEKKPYQLTYRILAAGGEVKWVWDQGVGVWNVAGNLLALEGIITDVTERKMIEEALHEAHNELEKVNLHLEKLAQEDGLTGLANRRHFNETLDAEVRRACRTGEYLSLILCDIDYFKRYNDHLGHLAGDRCLMSIGKLMQRVFRRVGELPARYGGEEFVVILPDVPPDKAARLAEKLRREILSEAIPHPDSDVSEWVTLSVGVVGARVTLERKGEWFTREADNALYESKRNGRNRVTCSFFDETAG